MLYTEALNYLNRFWKEIFTFLDDGVLPIDNNLAERTIRKLTIQRYNSLHYGSDAGAGIMLTWFLTKSHWLQAHIEFKTN